MFDPNVSDPLVIERGPESYGVIAPMDYVVNAAIYYDIAHMRVANAENKLVKRFSERQTDIRVNFILILSVVMKLNYWMRLNCRFQIQPP